VWAFWHADIEVCLCATCPPARRRGRPPIRIQDSTISPHEWGRPGTYGGMGKSFDDIDDRLAEWLVEQPVFFVATAPLAADGSSTVHPRAIAMSFAVVGPRTSRILTRPAVGVETIAHVKENGRVVVMFCAFSGPRVSCACTALVDTWGETHRRSSD